MANFPIMATSWCLSPTRRAARTIGILLALTVPFVNANAQGMALSLGDAARLAAKQSASVDVARARVESVFHQLLDRRSRTLDHLTCRDLIGYGVGENGDATGHGGKRQEDWREFNTGRRGE